jgi:hypothetical protein
VTSELESGPLVLTVILNYRTAEMTLESAKAALREMEGIAGEIVIVDNDSGDGSFEAMTEGVRAAGWTRVRVLQSGRNGGYGAGNNFGVRAGLSDGRRPDYVYILNSDAFPDAGAIRALVEALEADPKLGFAGSYIHGPDGEPHLTAFRHPSIWSEFEGAARTGPVTRLLKKHVVALPIPEATCEVEWLAGASVMMRRKALDEIGLFDERFFLYFEETDLFRRARRAGWRTLYVRESSVTHIGSVSTGMKTWRRMPGYWFDSRLHYFVKNHGALYAGAATLATLAGGLIWRSRRLVQRKPEADPPRFLRDLAGHSLRALTRGVLRPGRAPVSEAKTVAPGE